MGYGLAGLLEVIGSYAAPPGPDWRWRTIVETAEEDRLQRLQIFMYNISPGGKEDLAVDATYSRAD